MNAAYDSTRPPLAGRTARVTSVPIAVASNQPGAARCSTIRVDCSNATEWRIDAVHAPHPHHVADRLDFSSDIVVRESVRRHGSWVRR
ncbi:hypothetical protein [Burkholderia sp. BCC1993]|uniref:hypothetical protein n=1 Tax=Burkholderia sp. BCC1993 TaxID=2817444 RepID=UPI002AB1B584|nr:hypothetical protein [Burkholderia sp. BCC1993]